MTPHNSLLFLTLTALVGISTQQNCLSENEIGEVPKTIYADLYRGEQSFSVSMLDAIRRATPTENVFFSPYSTYHALLLAYFGARGETEQELIKVLNLQWAKNKNHVARAYSVEKQSRRMRAKTMPLEFASADKIYFSKEVKLDDCMSSLFHEELAALDFRQQPEECRMQINSWIANLTRNEIVDMLNQGDVDTETQLVLANAAYFKGQWANKFDAKYTKQEIFYTSATKRSFVPMMSKTGTFNLAVDDNLGAHVLELPYLTSAEGDEEQESSISMVIILPPANENSLEMVLSKLTPDSLDRALKEGMMREIEVSLPKFEFKQTLELAPILREMGLNLIFGEGADLSGFSAANKLSIGDAKHVAKIKVDEEGSTAAAATVLLSFRSARPADPVKVECNHPFLFLIYDKKTRAVLFTGLYRDPMTQKGE